MYEAFDISRTPTKPVEYKIEWRFLMTTLKTLKGQQDPIIVAVLDEIFNVSNIDPAAINPDYKLGSDLGLSRIDVQLVLSQAAKSLGMEVAFENCRIEDSSPREIVNILRRWDMVSARRVA
jgi:hypothetical protein